MRAGLVTALAVALLSPFATAATLEVPATQVGGFTPGSAANLPSFQNYYVGYASVTGSGGKERTEERRSFFVFEIPEVSGTVTGATLRLEMMDPFGIAYGLGPGTFPAVCSPYPSVEVCKAAISDTTEAFALGVASVPIDVLLDPALLPEETEAVWTALESVPAAAPHVFMKGMPLPPGTTPGYAKIEIPLEGPGMAAIVTHEGGGSIVLSGWMPTWSDDDRKVPGDVFFEGSEAIFMFSDAHLHLFETPTLEIVYVPVPEPATWAMLAAGMLVCGVFGIRTRRHSQDRPSGTRNGPVGHW